MKGGKILGFDSLFSGSHCNEKSNSFIIWAIILIIVFGFGKGKNCLNTFACFENTDPCCNDHHHHHSSRHHEKECCCYPTTTNFCGTGCGIGNLFGGNTFFILIIVALLFLCRDSDDRCTSDAITNCDSDD